MPTPKKGALRVWHIPQIPGKPFHVEVRDVREATLILKSLALYDLFQLKHRIKPDYSNAQGLEVFEGGEWCEWECKNGENIDHYLRAAP
jgi:hypothetical protein